MGGGTEAGGGGGGGGSVEMIGWELRLAIVLWARNDPAREVAIVGTLVEGRSARAVAEQCGVGKRLINRWIEEFRRDCRLAAERLALSGEQLRGLMAVVSGDDGGDDGTG